MILNALVQNFLLTIAIKGIVDILPQTVADLYLLFKDHFARGASGCRGGAAF